MTNGTPTATVGTPNCGSWDPKYTSLMVEPNICTFIYILNVTYVSSTYEHLTYLEMAISSKYLIMNRFIWHFHLVLCTIFSQNLRHISKCPYVAIITFYYVL